MGSALLPGLRNLLKRQTPIHHLCSSSTRTDSDRATNPPFTERTFPYSISSPIFTEITIVPPMTGRPSTMKGCGRCLNTFGRSQPLSTRPKQNLNTFRYLPHPFIVDGLPVIGGTM